jgi:hypothetical protein
METTSSDIVVDVAGTTAIRPLATRDSRSASIWPSGIDNGGRGKEIEKEHFLH